MSDELRRQLRDYGRLQEAHQQPIALSEVLVRRRAEPNGVSVGAILQPDVEISGLLDVHDQPEIGSDDMYDQRRFWTLSIAAAAVLAVIGMTLFAGNSTTTVSDDAAEQLEVNVTAAPGTTEPAQVTPSFTEQDALALVDRWYDAIADGDLAAMEAAYPETETDDVRPWAFRMAIWEAHQQTVRTDRACRFTPVSEEVYDFDCTYLNQRYLRRVVGAGLALVESSGRVVAGDGVRNIITDYSSFRFEDVEEPFLEWMAVEHPEELASVECCPASLEAAVEMGQARVEFADLYVASLTDTE